MMILKTNKLFRKYVSLSWLSCLGTSLYYIALMTYAANLPYPALGILIITASQNLPMAFSIILGSLADTTQERTKRLIQSGWFRGLMYFVIGILIMVTNALWAMILIGFLNGASNLFGEFANFIKMPFITFMVKKDELKEAIGINKSVIQGIDALGGFLGVLFLGFLGIYVLAFFNAFIFFGLAVGFKLLQRSLTEIEDKMPSTTQITSPRLMLNHIGKRLRKLNHMKELRNFLLLAALMNVLFESTLAVNMIRLAENESFQWVDYGFSVTLIKLFILGGRILAGLIGGSLLKNIGMSKHLAASLLSVLIVLLFLHAEFFWLSVAFLMMATFFAGIFVIHLQSILFQSVPSHALGTIIGYIDFILATLPIPFFLLMATLATLSLPIYIITSVTLGLLALVGIWKFKLDKVDFKKSLLKYK